MIADDMKITIFSIFFFLFYTILEAKQELEI